MNDPITTTYKEVEITYDEHGDQWTFHVRGRERKAKSLALAKKAIEKPDPSEKKPFEPVEAIYLAEYSYYGPAKVTVTSLAEARASNRQEVWIKEKNGNRRKVTATDIYAMSQHNIKLLNRMRELHGRVETLEKGIKEKRKLLEQLIIEF